ncbi:hypothetical protein HYX02_04580 [Candidatus Woesearchaeota archaeon]|nr:hypothetical protein [Candidatus Woesearchaeota archaeon]
MLGKKRLGVINIFGKFFLRGISLSNVGRTIKQELAKIRHDLEEHLQTINENTNEIVANYEYICEIEAKLDRLSARIDEIQMFLESNGAALTRRSNFEVKKLSRMEQQVFLVIYTLEEEKGSITYDDIAEKLGISGHLAASYVTSIIEKGVPIIKCYLNSKPFLKLDPVFKTLQTKENILQLSLEEFGF